MKIYLIGIGMGNGKTMTEDARSVLERSDAFIGSKRALELVKNIDKPVFESYKPDDISKYLSEHGEYNEVSILLSGDTSFYSGAKRLKKRLREYKTEILPGISSFSYMCAKIGTAIEDTEAVSLHGTDKSLMCRIRDNRYTFALLGRAAEAEKICSDL